MNITRKLDLKDFLNRLATTEGTVSITAGVAWFEDGVSFELPSHPPCEAHGWLITGSPDGQYLYVQRDGAPGDIHIKAEHEGFVVDIWSDGDDTEVVGSASALYTELEPE